MENQNVRIFSDAQAIQSERASDFDVYSAYGEVLDNSVEADSKNIKIKFNISKDQNRGKNFSHLNSVAFGDDGSGMNNEILHHCLQLGYSSRYGSRKGIGRFGVGMTKGAISQCKRIEVYSKTDTDNSWSYTYFDIEEIEKNNSEAIINYPISADIPKEFENLVGTKHGTLVIWSKIDKQDKSANEIIEESKIWIGRTFRKFIFNGIKFFIDNNEIKAIDPLYLMPEFTNFPDDPRATEWGDKFKIDSFEWEIDDPEILKKGGPKKSTVTIRYSLLPEEFRSRGGGRRQAGDHEENNKRHVYRNEGISILRNNREVRDPEFDIPYWKPKPKEIDRFWGCEISFSAELDNWFQVKNIKRGAAPLKEMREELMKRINTVTKSLQREIQKHWDILEEPIAPPEGVQIGNNHGQSTKIATETINDTKPKDLLSVAKEPEDEIEKFVTTTFSNISPEKGEAFVEFFRNNMITILERPSGSANFFEITHFGSGKSNITYNTNHVFCNKYFELLNNIKSNNETDGIDKQQILVLIDLIIIAYSMAESQFQPDQNYKAEDFLEDLMRNWGKYLRDLLKKWTEHESK